MLSVISLVQTIQEIHFHEFKDDLTTNRINNFVTKLKSCCELKTFSVHFDCGHLSNSTLETLCDVPNLENVEFRDAKNIATVEVQRLIE